MTTTTPYAPIAAGRALGKLASAIENGDMTLNQATWSARINWNLDMDGADWVIDRLNAEYLQSDLDDRKGRA